MPFLATLGEYAGASGVVARFWPSVVSGAKTAGSVALGYLGFGEAGAAIGAASGAKTVTGAAVRATAGYAGAKAVNAVTGGVGIKLTTGNQNFFDDITTGGMFAETKKESGKTTAESAANGAGFKLPVWAQLAAGAAIIIGTVLVVKAAMK